MRRHSFFVLIGVFFCCVFFSVTALAATADRQSVSLPGTAAKTDPSRQGAQAKSAPEKKDAEDKKATETKQDVAEKKDEIKREKAAEQKSGAQKDETKKDEEKKRDEAGKKPETHGRAAKPEPEIRVGLREGQASVVIRSGAAYVLTDAATGHEIQKFSANKAATVTVKSGNLVVDDKPVSTKKLRFSVADSRTAGQISVAGEFYRGNILLVLAEDKTITVVNEVKLDDYIGGVISEEMSPEWPFEALKAQAVAARTFAVYSLGLHDEDGYDVCATTHCQVYGGIESESPEGLRAVSATRGEIMTYQGKAIYAAFHASSGGATAGSEEAGGTALPYLKSVRDAQDESTPNRHWQVSMSVKQLSSELAHAGFSVGTLKAIELSTLHIGQGASDRYPSGRVRHIRFVGSKQAISVPGPKLRWIADLPSTLVDVRYGTGKKTTPNTKGKIEISDQNATIIFDGYGRGHGIGLSQWGAYAMAAKSKYREILSHYYQGVKFTFLF